MLEIWDETWLVQRAERTTDGWFVEVQSLSERPLFYVAATRARDELVVMWEGEGSEFLRSAGGRQRSAEGSSRSVGTSW